MDLANLDKMKVVDLRNELQTRGLDTKGVKAVLIERLRAHLEGGVPPSPGTPGRRSRRTRSMTRSPSPSPVKKAPEPALETLEEESNTAIAPVAEEDAGKEEKFSTPEKLQSLPPKECTPKEEKEENTNNNSHKEESFESAEEVTAAPDVETEEQTNGDEAEVAETAEAEDESSKENEEQNAKLEENIENEEKLEEQNAKVEENIENNEEKEDVKQEEEEEQVEENNKSLKESSNHNDNQEEKEHSEVNQEEEISPSSKNKSLRERSRSHSMERRERHNRSRSDSNHSRSRSRSPRHKSKSRSRTRSRSRSRTPKRRSGAGSLGSPSKTSEDASTPEDEPTIEDNQFGLSWFDSDLHLRIDPVTFTSAKPMSHDIYALVWSGARTNYGVREGKVCFEVRFRVGFSMPSSNLLLGESENSFAYCESGRKATKGEFVDFAKPFQLDDVIGCYLDLESTPCNIKYTLNGEDLGVAFEFDKDILGEDQALFPHVLTKGYEYEINLADNDNLLVNKERKMRKRRKVKKVEEKKPEEDEKHEGAPKEEHEKMDEGSQADESEEAKKEEKEKSHEDSKDEESKSTEEEENNENKKEQETTKQDEEMPEKSEEQETKSEQEETKTSDDEQKQQHSPANKTDQEKSEEEHKENNDQKTAEEKSAQKDKDDCGPSPSKRQKLESPQEEDEYEDIHPEPREHMALLEGYELIALIAEEKYIPGPQRPENRSACEVILMVGLPGAGKTTWVLNHIKENPDKRYHVIGADALIAKMTIDGAPRKTVHKGRFDRIYELCFNVLTSLEDIAVKRRRNFILDQANAYASAQRRKMKGFAEFKRIAVVCIPNEEELKRRLDDKKEKGNAYTLKESTLNTLQGKYFL
ncbi:Heterogeneous nuclear ribonucleoprotein U-like protein 1 [Lucilia cuprina]|nr:Heterogeneous nuclear ribonucleoprotein U-like protein 1 [Lucilia cuprina]